MTGRILVVKSINDTHGYDAGDDVLREFALRIRKASRSGALPRPSATAATAWCPLTQRSGAHKVNPNA